MRILFLCSSRQFWKCEIVYMYKGSYVIRQLCFPEPLLFSCLIFEFHSLTNIPLCPLELLHCWLWVFGLYFCDWESTLNFSLPKFCGSLCSRWRLFWRGGIRGRLLAWVSWGIAQDQFSFVLRPNPGCSGLSIAPHSPPFWRTQILQGSE